MSIVCSDEIDRLYELERRVKAWRDARRIVLKLNAASDQWSALGIAEMHLMQASEEIK